MPDLAEARRKQAGIAAQLAGSQSEIRERDKSLGLTDLKDATQRAAQEAESLARQEARVRAEMASLEEQVARTQSQLLKARHRADRLWLVPDKSATTKEPILTVVWGSGIAIERFDHPDQRRKADRAGAAGAFQSCLREARPLDQYVVFEVKPSGIGLFQDLSKSARERGFEIGFDAVEENREVHAGVPPSLDGPESSASAPSAGPAANATPAASTTPVTTNPSPGPPAPPTKPAAPQKSKSWWQRLLEHIGLS